MKTKTAISKTTALLLCLVLVIGVLPLTAFAADTLPLGDSTQPMSGQIGTFAHLPAGTPLGTFDGVEYTALGGTNAKVSGYDSTLPADLTIPSTVEFSGESYVVTEIGGRVFYSCTSLTSVVIPDSVTSIGMSVFLECYNLTAVAVAAGNMYFSAANGVLYNYDKSLLISYPLAKPGTNFSIPNSVTEIGFGAFGRGANLTNVVIPDSVQTIGGWAFAFCTSLTSITIPDSVQTIGGWAFYFCTSLTTVSFHDATPPSIGMDTFSNCTSLTTINVPIGSESAYKAALPDYASLIVDKDIKPPTTSSGGSSGSSGGGKADGARPTTTTTTTRPVTNVEATKLIDTALAAKPAGATTLSIRVQNKTSVTKEVLAELAASAKKNGVILTVHFDTVVGGKVVGRISVNPALATTNLDLTVTVNKALAARFTKFYSNPLAAFTIKTGGSVAIKLPANLKAEDLVLYSYDTATNTYAVIPHAKPWVDKNGYLHFEFTAGTEVVVSQGKLVKK